MGINGEFNCGSFLAVFSFEVKHEMSNLHEIPGHREMKLPERARWGTFCAMEQQACDLLVTASRMLAGAGPAPPEMRPSPSGTGKFWKRGVPQSWKPGGSPPPAGTWEMSC